MCFFFFFFFLIRLMKRDLKHIGVENMIVTLDSLYITMYVCMCVFPLHSSSLLKDKLRLRISNFKAIESKSCTLWPKVLTEFHGLVQWYTGHPTLPTGHVRVDVGLEPVCPLPQLLDRYTELALRPVVDQSLASLRVVVHHVRDVSHKVFSLSGKTKKYT